jgi:hypothetical protein
LSDLVKPPDITRALLSNQRATRSDRVTENGSQLGYGSAPSRTRAKLMNISRRSLLQGATLALVKPAITLTQQVDPAPQLLQ